MTIAAKFSVCFYSSFYFRDKVTEEDIKVCEAVQERLSSGGYLTPGYLSPRHENGVAYFQERGREGHKAHADPEDRY